MAIDNLNEIGQKALKLAKEAPDPETLLKALEANRIVRELQHQERESKSLKAAERLAAVVTPATAVFAVFLSLGALAFQFYQFNKSARAQAESAETSQWRDALKSMSLRDDSSVLSSLVQLQSFFGSEPYSTQSRAVASMILPCVTSGAGFDSAVGEMRAKSNAVTQRDIIAVAQAVIDEDWHLYSEAREGIGKKSFADFLEDPTPAIADGETFIRKNNLGDHAKLGQANGATSVTECEGEDWSNPLKRALVSSYNADTISKQLARLWREHKETAPGPAKLGISGLVLENTDLTNVDFSGSSLNEVTINKSNLSGADLRNTKLEGAVFTNLTGFATSKWDGAHWWEMRAADCKLVTYLRDNYPPPLESSPSADRFLRKACETR